MDSLTVIYYTSNREGEEFEEKIRQNLLSSCNNLSIVSVSQKPISLGTNICVGDVGVSGFNMFRQVQIACEAAKTEWVIAAEADCLYPPDYFTPPLGIWSRECYRNTNLYVMGQWRKYFYLKKEGATHAQVTKREFYLRALQKLFTGAPQWSVEEKNFPKERTHNKQEDVFDKKDIFFYDTRNPIVQIKTTRSMRHYTHSERVPIEKIPYWGSGESFRKKYYGDN